MVYFRWNTDPSSPLSEEAFKKHYKHRIMSGLTTWQHQTLSTLSYIYSSLTNALQ